MKPKVLLFDIGGVLVELTGVRRLIEYGKYKPVAPDEISSLWMRSESVRLFETGQCDAETFAEGIIQELGLDIGANHFIREFTLFPIGFYPGAAALLRKARPLYTIACFSNTNVVQWESLHERISIETYFDRCFLSYRMGKMKPDADAYADVIEQLGCAPEEIAYFDDLEENVRAGASAGMHACLVKDFADTEAKIQALDLIP